MLGPTPTAAPPRRQDYGYAELRENVTGKIQMSRYQSASRVQFLRQHTNEEDLKIIKGSLLKKKKKKKAEPLVKMPG